MIGIVAFVDSKLLNDIINHLESKFKVTKSAMDYYVGFQVRIDPLSHS
jgi:hypothetical protein